MATRPFFLTRTWIGAGQQITGAAVALYAFVELVRYPRAGPLPALYGPTQMAFSTAWWLFWIGLSMFWGGWDLRHNGYKRPEEARQPYVFAVADLAHLLVALISLISAIIVALTAALR